MNWAYAHSATPKRELIAGFVRMGPIGVPPKSHDSGYICNASCILIRERLGATGVSPVLHFQFTSYVQLTDLSRNRRRRNPVCSRRAAYRPLRAPKTNNACVEGIVFLRPCSSSIKNVRSKPRNATQPARGLRHWRNASGIRREQGNPWGKRVSLVSLARASGEC